MTEYDGSTGTVAARYRPEASRADLPDAPPTGTPRPAVPTLPGSDPTTGAGGDGRPARSTGPATGPAPANGSALTRCVAVEPAKFAAAYWGRAALLSRAAELGNPDGFRDLLSPDDADELLSRRGLRTPFLRVARNGQVLPTGQYTGGGGAGAEITDQVLDERVLALYADGATLVLQGLHRTWPPLIDFTRELSRQLGQPLQVNAYLTPPGNQGFATHYDTHDVFVLQVDGHKHWQIHEPVLPDPLERQPWGGRADEVAAVADGPPALDVVLGPGDALYLPRGWLHSARAQDESSLHLTVGVRALTRYAMVEALLELATEDPRLRATLPFGMDVAEVDQVEPELTETVEALRDWLLRADPGEVAARLRARAWPAARPAPIRPLAQAAAISAVHADTRLVPRDGLRWRLTSQPAGGDGSPGRVVLSLFDRTVTFPAQCGPALRAFLSGAAERVGDLPGLDDDADRIVLARRLLREAVAVPV
ncbi:cupin [Plantactinospora sp. BC1]|uniref:cupin domain-containing protein n=1 Tax=Plantactinospora sp. BC1 TaxID=2108470 RepID=UPI000D16A3B0|nr:cupin domain-containing protein [Plantactinospora sp. BC1]AVT28623.1 cupin [Plantactinospora sp. BC1]